MCEARRLTSYQPDKENEAASLTVLTLEPVPKVSDFKTFYAGCVQVYIWGVVTDFVTFALDYPPIYSKLDLPTGIGSCFNSVTQ